MRATVFNEVPNTRMRAHAGVIALLWASVLLAPVPVARAESEFQCVGTAPAPVVRGNLTVPRNTACTLAGHRITGNLVVLPGGHLNANSIFVGGNVWADTPDAIFIDGFFAGPSEIIGDVQSTGGARVSTAISSSIVGGDVEFVDIDSGNVGVSGVRVGGNIKFQNNVASDYDLLGNNVGGNLQFFDNRGPGEIIGNRVFGNLQCWNNMPPPAVAGNVVDGETECPPIP
jgi:hypothetical protein